MRRLEQPQLVDIDASQDMISPVLVQNPLSSADLSRPRAVPSSPGHVTTSMLQYSFSWPLYVDSCPKNRTAFHWTFLGPKSWG